MSAVANYIAQLSPIDREIVKSKLEHLKEKRPLLETVLLELYIRDSARMIQSMIKTRVITKSENAAAIFRVKAKHRDMSSSSVFMFIEDVTRDMTESQIRVVEQWWMQN